jgi:threonine dehydrogenase-like Zn-dependent dehydrogenase
VKAITLAPGIANSAQLEDIEAPSVMDGSLLAKTIAVGVCGTDLEILGGEYGSAPLGRRMVLGHEALAEVVDCRKGEGFSKGDFIVPIVRRPDSLPCPSCAADEWDMCSNGGYTERGIKDADGYASEYFRVAPEFAVKVPPELGLLAVLTEPMSVVAKAWAHIDALALRGNYPSKRVLVTGAGPVGLLAALVAQQRGYEVRVLDRELEGIKPALVHELGATYCLGSVEEAGAGANVILECTGAPSVVLSLLNVAAPNSVKCLLGVAPGTKELPFDVGMLTRRMVLNNEVVFGSVNANRLHYCQAVEMLRRAPKDWLGKLITRRVSLTDWPSAYEKRPGDIKTVLLFGGA